MDRFRVVVVLLLLACLPLKGVAAIAMPFCGGEMAASSAHTGHGVGHMHDHAPHVGTADHAVHGDAASAASNPSNAPMSACTKCGLCHLACASALPVASMDFRVRFDPVFVAAASGEFVSFIPEVLFRPPLPTLA